MPTQLPSGRWRTRVRQPRTGKQMSACAVIGGPDTYATKQTAVAAEAEARKLLRANARIGVTLGEWWTTWTTDPLWARPAESTNIHNRERTEKFARLHWDTPIRAIGDEHVAAWLKGGANKGTLDKLRLMFNDAASAPGGRLVDRNPFANLRLPRSRGRKDTQPPNEAGIARFIHLAATVDDCVSTCHSCLRHRRWRERRCCPSGCPLAAYLEEPLGYGADSRIRFHSGETDLWWIPKYRAGNHHLTRRPAAVRRHQHSAEQPQTRFRGLCRRWVSVRLIGPKASCVLGVDLTGLQRSSSMSPNERVSLRSRRRTLYGSGLCHQGPGSARGSAGFPPLFAGTVRNQDRR